MEVLCYVDMLEERYWHCRSSHKPYYLNMERRHIGFVTVAVVVIVFAGLDISRREESPRPNDSQLNCTLFTHPASDLTYVTKEYRPLLRTKRSF